MRPSSILPSSPPVVTRVSGTSLACAVLPFPDPFHTMSCSMGLSAPQGRVWLTCGKFGLAQNTL
jgi:hypothetical protein